MADLAEGEEDVFEGDVEEVDAVVFVLQRFALVEKGEVVVGFVGELVELAEVELFQEFELAGEPDEIVEALGVIERLDKRAHLGAVFDLSDLLGEDLGVLGIEVEERVLDGLDVGSDLGLGLEEIGVVLDFVASSDWSSSK